MTLSVESTAARWVLGVAGSLVLAAFASAASWLINHETRLVAIESSPCSPDRLERRMAAQDAELVKLRIMLEVMVERDKLVDEVRRKQAQMGVAP